MITTTAHTDIAAPASAVWSAVTDLTRYAEWNTLVTRASGTVELDGVVRLRIFHHRGASMTLAGRVIDVEAGTHLHLVLLRGVAWWHRLEVVVRLRGDGARSHLTLTVIRTGLATLLFPRTMRRLPPLLDFYVDRDIRERAIALHLEQLAAR